MLRSAAWATVAGLLVSTPSAAQVLVAPMKLRATDGADTAPLERAVEDAVWRGAARAGVIISDLKAETRTKILGCQGEVRCLGDAARPSGARFLLVPGVRQQGQDLVISTYVIAVDRPRIVRTVLATWPEPKEPEVLIASVQASMIELSLLLRGEEELPPEPAPLVAAPPAAADRTAPDRATADHATRDREDPPARAAAADAQPEPAVEEPPPRPDLAAWAKAARERAAKGSIALRVIGEATAAQLEHFVRSFGDAVEEVAGLAPILDEVTERCTQVDLCVPALLERTHAKEALLATVRRSARGYAVEIERLGRREGAIRRVEAELSPDATPIGKQPAELARYMFPEGKDMTPEIPR